MAVTDEFILSRIEIDRGTKCWTWNRKQNRGGYCRVSIGGRKTKLAHRLVFEFLVGPIENGMQLDHLCRNRMCVNPTHLEPVNHKTNVLRGFGPTAENHRRVCCANGHHFAGANMRLSTGGRRVCRVCERARSIKYTRTNPDKRRKQGRDWYRRNKERPI